MATPSTNYEWHRRLPLVLRTSPQLLFGDLVDTRDSTRCLVSGGLLQVRKHFRPPVSQVCTGPCQCGIAVKSPPLLRP
jgi:hypothetical protein